MACGHASRRTQQVIDQRCVRPASANDTSTTGTHVSFGDLAVSSPCEEPSRCMARFTTPHALRMQSVQAFRSGRFLPATSTELHPLTLPSPRSACPPVLRARRLATQCTRAFACERRPPRPMGCGGVCERAAKTTRSRRSVRIAASTDDPERLPSDGRSLAPRELPLAAFRFGTPPRSPGLLRAFTTTTPFVRLLPTIRS